MGKIASRLPLEALVSTYVRAGCSLGLGGLHYHNTPMAVVREIIRQRIPLGLLIPPLDGSLNADQLIGAGLVAEVQVAYLGTENFGLAGRFRAAVEAGRLRVRDCEEAGFTLALQAGAAGLPFAALPSGFLPRVGTLPGVAAVNPTDYQPITNPFSGEAEMLVRAIAPQVAAIHCQYIDRRGNCGFLGACFLDLEIARAARCCLVQAEHEVDELPGACRDRLPGYVVDAYCVIEGGAHPASSHGRYGYDQAHIEAYVAAAGSDAGFARYRDEVIGESEQTYREHVDIATRLAALARALP